MKKVLIILGVFLLTSCAVQKIQEYPAESRGYIIPQPFTFYNEAKTELYVDSSWILSDNIMLLWSEGDQEAQKVKVILLGPSDFEKKLNELAGVKREDFVYSALVK